MKKYYVVEVSEYVCGNVVRKMHIVKTAHPEALYDEFYGNCTISYQLRPATRAERRAYKAGYKSMIIDIYEYREG